MVERRGLGRYRERTVQTMSELKPCPFCGAKSKGDMVATHRNEGGYWQVFCFSCGASTTWFHIEVKAKMAWNRRVGYVRE